MPFFVKLQLNEKNDFLQASDTDPFVTCSGIMVNFRHTSFNMFHDKPSGIY